MAWKMISRFASWGSVLSVGLAVVGCSPDLGDAPFKCNTGEPKCPSGYSCNKAKVCVPEGECPVGVAGCPAASCGNSKCDNGETCSSCAKDCGKCSAKCGDGTCSSDEHCKSCPADCGRCAAGCGDGTCASTEDCSTCQPDCGKCSSGRCGDGKCNSGETVSNCPVDCSSSGGCGDGKCDSGETATSCPKDCGGSCSGDQTKCQGTTSLSYCEGGSWKSDTCANLCTKGQYDYSVGCSTSSSQSKDVCVCGHYRKFGETCDTKQKCASGLFCGTFGSGSSGFCTKYCTVPDSVCSGAPAPYTARCNLQVGSKYACGFSCNLLSSCPQGLTCDLAGQVCKPN